MEAVAAGRREFAAMRKELRVMKAIQSENAGKLDKVIEQQKTDSAVIEVAAEWIQVISGMKTGGVAITNVAKWGAYLMMLLSVITGGLLWMKTGVATFFGGK